MILCDRKSRSTGQPRWHFTSQLLALGAIALSSGCSLVLDFDKPVGSTSDSGTDAMMVQVDAMVTPLPDAMATACNASDTELEPNNNTTSFTTIGTEITSILCTDSPDPADVDYFRFLVGSGEMVDIVVVLTRIDGELTGMRLRDAAGTSLIEADGTDMTTTISRLQSEGDQLGPGIYFIEVYSQSDATTKANYQLMLTQTPTQ